MKRRLRSFLTIFLAIFVGMAFAPVNPVLMAKDARAKRANLRFSWWGSDARHKATLNAMQAYMQKNPHVKLDAEYMGYDGYYKKLLTQLAGKTAPDIIQIDTQWTSELYAQSDFFLDLNRYESLLDRKTFNPALIADYSLNQNKFKGVPTGVSATTMLCDEDFFDKYGIPKKASYTWDELLAMGRKVHQQNNRVHLLTSDIEVVNRLIVRPYLAQKTGKDWINPDYSLGFDQQLLTQTLKYVADLYQSGTMEPFGESSTFVGKMEQNIKWINGEIGAVICLASNIPQMKSTVSSARSFFVAELPMHQDARQSANPLRATSLLCINKATKYPEEAVKFLNWFVNDKEAALLLGDVRSTPASSAALQVLVDARQLDPLIMTAMEMVGKNPGKPWGALTENSEISQINKDVLEKLAFNKITPEQGAKAIITEYKVKLAELKATRR